MSTSPYLLLALTALAGLLAGLLALAVIRFRGGAVSVRHHFREGTPISMLASALQDQVGRLKAQEQAMSARAVASELLSDQIVASLTAGLLVVDRAGTIRILNPSGRHILGLAEESIGADVKDVLTIAPQLLEVISGCLATDLPVVRRTLEMPPALGTSHIGVTVSPLGEAGAHTGVICLFSDLTTVFELEEQLRLKETLARLGELTAGIAHEFRNGLATIHGYGRLIDPDALPPQYQPYVQGIRQETETLGHIVTNFLAFAKPEQVSFAPVDLAALVNRAVEDIRHELPAGTQVDVSGDFLTVEGDDVTLKQVFTNLVRNAAEASEGAGRMPAITIHGQVDAAHGVCRISVDDNGPGIPEASRLHVFRPFFTTRSRGTGLGLAIVQRIVLTHNGRVAVAQSASGGASIQITLRAAMPGQARHTD